MVSPSRRASNSTSPHCQRCVLVLPDGAFSGGVAASAGGDAGACGGAVDAEGVDAAAVDAGAVASGAGAGAWAGRWHAASANTNAMLDRINRMPHSSTNTGMQANPHASAGNVTRLAASIRSSRRSGHAQDRIQAQALVV